MIMSLRAYARHRSVSHTAVQKAVKAGYISKAIIKTKAGIKINSRIADREWYPNRPTGPEKPLLCTVCGKVLNQNAT